MRLRSLRKLQMNRWNHSDTVSDKKMARRIVPLEEKIEKAQINVAEAKAKYDKAVDELEKLLTKRQERDKKQLLEAFSESEKTLAEAIEFLQGDKVSQDWVLKIAGSWDIFKLVIVMGVILYLR